MTKKKVEGRGPLFATGSLRRPREALVDWPAADPEGPSIEDVGPASIDPDEPTEDVHAELARAKQEIRRLLAKVQELSEENERLRTSRG